MERRLLRLLSPWELRQPRILAELGHPGDRSRTWRVGTGDGDFVAKLVFDHRAAVEPGLRIAALLDRAGTATGAPLPTRSGALTGRAFRPRGAPGLPHGVSVMAWI